MFSNGRKTVRDGGQTQWAKTYFGMRMTDLEEASTFLGNRAIVGAPHFGIGSGAAFIFERQVDGVDRHEAQHSQRSMGPRSTVASMMELAAVGRICPTRPTLPMNGPSPITCTNTR